MIISMHKKQNKHINMAVKHNLYEQSFTKLTLPKNHMSIERYVDSK